MQSDSSRPWRGLSDPFTALLLFGAAGIVAMTVSFAVTALPRPDPGVTAASPASAAATAAPRTPAPVATPPGGGDGGGD